MAADHDGVLSLAQLRACGLSNRAIARRVRDGRLHRVHRGVYAVGHPAITLRGHLRAAVLACGENAVLSHFAAAAYWGFWSWEERLVDVTIVASGTRTIKGVRVHRSRALGHPDALWRDGMRVTTPARTLLDLAAILPEKGLRAIVRRAQAQRAVSLRQIHELLARCNGHHGAAQLRAVIADGPAPTRTELEDAVLDLLDAGGIERPEINAPLRFGATTIIPDYLWREQRLAIEADSVTWHDHKLTREHDADKQAQLEAAGYRVLRVTHDQAARSRSRRSRASAPPSTRADGLAHAPAREAPHYDGWPYVLVRLDAVDPVELGELLEEAWRVFAAKRAIKAWDAEQARLKPEV